MRFMRLQETTGSGTALTFVPESKAEVELLEAIDTGAFLSPRIGRLSGNATTPSLRDAPVLIIDVFPAVKPAPGDQLAELLPQTAPPPPAESGKEKADDCPF